MLYGVFSIRYLSEVFLGINSFCVVQSLRDLDGNKGRKEGRTELRKEDKKEDRKQGSSKQKYRNWKADHVLMHKYTC